MLRLSKLIAVAARFVLLAAAISLSAGSVAHAASPGQLDNTFHADGKLATTLGYYDGASGVVVQLDQKIVAAGGSTGDFALTRYRPDGSLDPTFSATAS